MGEHNLSSFKTQIGIQGKTRLQFSKMISTKIDFHMQGMRTPELVKGEEESLGGTANSNSRLQNKQDSLNTHWEKFIWQLRSQLVT